MEASILYTMIPLLGATYGGFVLRDIYGYVEDVFYLSSNDYVKYDIHLDELPQLLDYTVCESMQNNVHLNAICEFDHTQLRKKEASGYKQIKCNEQDIIEELRKRLKVIRKYTEET